MKLNLKFFIVLCFGAVLIYTGCTKLSDPGLSDPVLSPQAVAGQIAANLSGSLFGGLGAFDVSGGLSAPSTVAVTNNGKSLRRSLLKKHTLLALTNPYCGLVIDTTINYTTVSQDTSASVSGTVKFAFTCANGVVSGYTSNDNLSVSFSSKQLSMLYKVAENLTMLSLDPTNPNANCTLSGTLSSSGSYQFKTGSQRSGSQVFSYTLNSLLIDPASGDIVSGSASFSTSGSGPMGKWNYQGTITFLGNHQATVVIGGKSYNVTV